MRRMDQTRRSFCLLSCTGALATLLEGCGGGSPTSPSINVPALTTVQGSVSNRTVLVNVDASSPLATVGGAALITSSAGQFLVARTGQDTFAAVTAVCTHQGCIISGYQNSVYTCTCHGSQFGTSGNVLRGPAGQSLRTFATSFASPQLVINF
jgi:Rieske Fe-S protein